MVKHHLREARRLHAEEGFTLIEMLIVIVVLGILAGIVVFGVSTMRGDASVAACHADMKQVQVAAEAYSAKLGGYPQTVTELVNGGYLKSAPGTSVYTVTYANGGVNTGLPSGVNVYSAYTISGTVNGGASCGADLKS
jgi:prepilin-type N-terminal cleavage/methylation domain-containing protein